MQASGHYAQGSLMGLVDVVSMGTATPNRCAVLSRGMDQEKIDVRSTVASAPQLDPANRFRSPTRNVNFLRSDFKCLQNVSAHPALC